MSKNRIAVDFKILEGQVIRSIEKGIDENNLTTELFFNTKSNKKYRMYHDYECCEVVYLDDIVGDLHDLLDSPVLSAYETSNKEDERSVTWTFYNISTIKGSVTLKWYGSSNGYYSEDVYFEEILSIEGG